MDQLFFCIVIRVHGSFHSFLKAVIKRLEKRLKQSLQFHNRSVGVYCSIYLSESEGSASSVPGCVYVCYQVT